MMNLSSFIVSAPASFTPVAYKQEECQECPDKKFKDFALAHMEKEAENMKPEDKLRFMNQMQQLLSAMSYQLEGLIQLKNNPKKLQQEYNQLQQYFTDSANIFKKGCETYRHEIRSVMRLIETTHTTLRNTPAPVFGNFTAKQKKGADQPPLPPLPSFFDANIDAVRASSDAAYVFPSKNAELLYRSVTKLHQWFRETLSSLCETNPNDTPALSGYGYEPKHPKLCRFVKSCLPDSLRPKTALILRSTDHLAIARKHGSENFQELTFQRIDARYDTQQRFFWDETIFCDAINKVTKHSGPIDLLVIRTDGTWLSFNPSSTSRPIYTTSTMRPAPFACLCQLANDATVVIDSSSSGLGKELITTSIANLILQQSPDGATIYAPTEPSYGFTLQGNEFKFLSVKNPGRDITYKIDMSSFFDKRIELLNLKNDYYSVEKEFHALMEDVHEIEAAVRYGAH